MLASTCLISCNFSSFPRNSNPNPNNSSLISSQYPNPSISSSSSSSLSPIPLKFITKLYPLHKRTHLQICWNSINTQNSQDPISKKESPLPLESEENELDENGSEGEGEGGGGGGGEERDWTTSFLLFGLWVGLMYYIFNLTPNQTPSMDMYFLKKLLNLKGDDGFEMNQVLVSLWYIMGLWPLVYSMLLLPTARSSKGNVPVWPFVTLSFFGGAYVLLPYFVLWKPPPPPVEETELRKWPLNFLESKLTAGITVAAGLGLIVYAGLAGSDAWLEFYQYFRESKFIHVTSIDFSLLSTFAPFWVYNDMSVRKCDGKMGWLLPISLVPFLGPALYLLLRPSLSAVPVSLSSAAPEEK